LYLVSFTNRHTIQDNCMRIEIRTIVAGNFVDVYGRFDEDLFRALLPSFPRVKIIRFDGSESGDLVHMRFMFPFSFDWISRITDHGISETEAYFVDEGEKLPPGLRYWKHIHKIEKLDEQNCIILDDITFEGNTKFLNYLFYPFLYASFLPRKSIYRNYFEK